MNKLEQMRRKLKKPQQSIQQKSQVNKEQKRVEEVVEQEKAKGEQLQSGSVCKQNDQSEIKEHLHEAIKPQDTGHLTENLQGQHKAVEQPLNPIMEGQEHQQKVSSEMGQQMQGLNELENKKDIQNQNSLLQPSKEQPKQIFQPQDSKIQNTPIQQKQSLNQQQKKETLSKPEQAQIKHAAPPNLTPTQQQPKMSKIQMLRQKMRLKKLAQNLTLSNKSIPDQSNQEEKVNKETIPNLNERHYEKFSSQKKSVRQRTIQGQQQGRTQGRKKVHLNDHSVLQTETSSKDQQSHESLKKSKFDDGVIHMEKDVPQQIQQHQAIISEQQQKNNQQPSDLQIQPQKHQPTTPSHTLFYQLCELQIYLKPKQQQPFHHEQPINQSKNSDISIDGKKVRQFFVQIQQLKKNLEVQY